MRAVVFTLIVLFASSGFALEPEKGDLVTTSAPNATSFLIEDETAYIGASECATLLSTSAQVGGTFTPTFTPNDSVNEDNLEAYYFFSVTRDSTSKISCTSGELCTEITDDTDINLTDSVVEVNVDFTELTGFDSECGTADAEYFVRFVTKDDDDTLENNDVRFIVDTVSPAAPTGVTGTATENAINVSFTASADSDINQYYVYYSTSEFSDGAEPTGDRKVVGDADETSGEISVELESGAGVYFAVVAEDLAGNLSVVSNVVSSTAVETQDFWEVYKEAGGAEEGCSNVSAGTSIFALLLFLCFFFSRRLFRRRSLLIVAAITLLSANASAESPLWGTFELKGGGYIPSVDSEFSGTGPYETVFGTDSMFLYELEIDTNLLISWVDVGAGIHIGYGSVEGDALASTGTDQDGITDTTSFSVLPIRGSLVVKLGIIAREYNVPLVPNLKVGLDLVHWDIEDANGDTANVGDTAGSGWKPGWHLSLGLQLLLDVFAPGMASSMDLHSGVNNSYFFAEYMIAKIDGFGEDGLDLSDQYWSFGLAFDY